MTDWHKVARVSIFDDKRCFDVHEIDVDEHMDHQCGGSILAKELSSGKWRIYIPRSDAPDFDGQGKEIVVSDDSSVIKYGTIDEDKDYIKSGVEVSRYTLNG